MLEVDLSIPNRPMWRFRKVAGASRKGEKGIIPVRTAFRSLLSFLEAPPRSPRK